VDKINSNLATILASGTLGGSNKAILVSPYNIFIFAPHRRLAPLYPNKCQISSLDFVVDRLFLIKLFNTVN